MDIFDNIEKKIVIKSQNKKGDEIITARRGAPKKPNMVAKKLKVDKYLYKQISDYCQEKGITISSFYAQAARATLERSLK